MFEDDIRAALRATDKTLERLASETGIGRVHISMFKAATKGLGTANLDALAAALGLRIAVIPAKTGVSRTKKKPKKHPE